MALLSSTPAETPSTECQKIDEDLTKVNVTTHQHHHLTSSSLQRPISPPCLKRKPLPAAGPCSNGAAPTQRRARNGHVQPTFVPSPVQLTRIEDLQPSQNLDAVGLKEILGGSLIEECWNFNFLFDLDFVMRHFDHDVRARVKMKIIHGFWKRDDERRVHLLEAAERYPNIELLSAYIPDPFGTHHSKMIVLFRQDKTAQIIIHTANMIHRDWSNMTQAVWSSPLLPRSSKMPSVGSLEQKRHPIGSGKRFQADLIHYLAAYERRTHDLVRQLQRYDFSAIKAAFIGSAPSRDKPGASDPSRKTSFGWPGLQEILSQVPISDEIDPNAPPHIVTQISSIATLGAQPTWLMHFHRVLAQAATSSKVLNNHRSESREPIPAKLSVVFPTPEEIRTSLDGYASGGSIHWKLQSPQQQRQLKYMHSLLCHWKPPPPCSLSSPCRRNSHRGLAAPHAKTYLRFRNEQHTTIDWAMITSANLSKQAWGGQVNAKQQVWIQSWEAGVLVWPALFVDEAEAMPTTRAADDVVAAAAAAASSAIMVPVFGKDLPASEDVPQTHGVGLPMGMCGGHGPLTVVGFRVPYSLPLYPYEPDEKPWCATMRYGEPDGKGHVWEGY